MSSGARGDEGHRWSLPSALSKWPPQETDLSHGATVRQRRREDGAEQEGFPAHNR